jgi:hypothetical protein
VLPPLQRTAGRISCHNGVDAGPTLAYFSIVHGGAELILCNPAITIQVHGCENLINVVQVSHSLGVCHEGPDVLVNNWPFLAKLSQIFRRQQR